MIRKNSMPDSDESPVKAPDLIPKRRRFRLPFFFSIVSSSLLFACVGCCALTRWIFGVQEFESPVAVDQVVSKITTWTLPEGFSGKRGIIIDNLLMQFEFTLHVHKQGRGSIVLAQLHWKSEPTPQMKEQKKELIQKALEMLASDLKKINVTEKETRKITIRDVPAEFEIAHGEDRASTTKFRQVTGEFRGLTDDVTLILQCEEEILSDQQIDDFLKSIN
jgi:hypothetical protein